jgi:hypothetical protein
MRRSLLTIVGCLLAIASSVAFASLVSAQAVLTDDEQAYFDEMTPIFQSLSDSLPRASELMSNPQIFSDDWKLALAVELVTWKTAYQEALTITPPNSLANVHDEILESLRLLDEAADDMSVGIDEFDADKIELASSKIQLANEHINEATRLINEFALANAA